jgi:bifunctional non-homologous end joining protein LigD
MLATAGDPPTGEWAFEWKWDGVRAVVATDGRSVRAQSRNGNDVTSSYPELAALAGLAGHRPMLLDGEIVTLDEAGRPDFGLLQRRMHVRQPSADLLRSVPTAFYVFDLLRLSRRDLMRETYLRRREELAHLDLDDPPLLRVPDHYLDTPGTELLDIAREHGLEGVVAKRIHSRYRPGTRSREWIKTPLRLTQEVVIGGWTPGEGRRSETIGSLLLGVHDGERLAYAGHVGTGFTRQTLRDMEERLHPLRRRTSPFDTEVPRDRARKAQWVEPVLVGEVEHRQWTADRRLRHPSWRGLRPDREPEEAEIAARALGDPDTVDE